MLLRDDDFLGLPVVTDTGERIGRLAGVVLDTEGGIVVQFRVRPRGIVAALVPGRELLIHHSQVVSLDTERMVIRGGGIPDGGGSGKRIFRPSNQPQAATTIRSS